MANHPKIAKDLESAEPHDLVHVDGKGRVRSPLRLRVLTSTYWSVLGLLVVAEGWLGYQLMGTPGLSLAVVLGAFVAWVGSRHLLLRRATREALASNLDEAEARLMRIAHGRLVPRRMRASARSWLSYCASLRGDAEGALAHSREAVRLWGKRKHILSTISRYGEVYALTRCGQLDEARVALEALGPMPQGEYLRITHLNVGLYLAFVEGKHSFSDDELHEHSKNALGITAAGPLLALLAWAFEKNGDAEMAELLFEEAKDRHPGDLLSKRMPDLQRWMDERSLREDRRRVDVNEREDEELEAAAVARERRARG